MTFEEHRGPIEGQRIAWCGDGNNVARTWVQAAVRFGFPLRLASPASCEIPKYLLDWARREGGDVAVVRDPAEAVRGARAVVTDCWVSMADDPGRNAAAALSPYRVTAALMALAAPDAVFMHCLPAHRDEEVESAVIDGPQSLVFDEAENRLHAQKGVLAWAMG
jgi:ornithine carbamoyltransferase